jgi:hypothetical protein
MNDEKQAGVTIADEGIDYEKLFGESDAGAQGAVEDSPDTDSARVQELASRLSASEIEKGLDKAAIEKMIEDVSPAASDNLDLDSDDALVKKLGLTTGKSATNEPPLDGIEGLLSSEVSEIKASEGAGILSPSFGEGAVKGIVAGIDEDVVTELLKPKKPTPASISVTVTGLQAEAIMEFYELLGIGSMRQFVIHLIKMGLAVHELCTKGPLTGEKFAGAMYRVGQANLAGELKGVRSVTQTIEEYESWRQWQLRATHPRDQGPTRLVDERPGRGG